MLAQQDVTLCIPPRRSRKKPVYYSKRLDRKRPKSRRSFPDRRTGGVLQPATTAAPTSSVAWVIMTQSDVGQATQVSTKPASIWSLSQEDLVRLVNGAALELASTGGAGAGTAGVGQDLLSPLHQAMYWPSETPMVSFRPSLSLMKVTLQEPMNSACGAEDDKAVGEQSTVGPIAVIVGGSATRH